MAVAPPANSTIESRATATFTDSAGSSQSVSSNIVSTTVQQVYSHTMTSTQTVRVTRASTAQFFHTLRNTGNGPDTLSLSNFTVSGTVLSNIRIVKGDCATGNPVDNVAITSTGALPANSDFCFVVLGDVAATAVAGNSVVLQIGAQGNGADPGNYVASATAPTGNQVGNRDTVNVVDGAAFRVTQSMTPITGVGTPSSPLTITLTYQNIGSVAGTLNVSTLLGKARQLLPNVSTVEIDTLNLCYKPGSATDSSGNTVTFTAQTPGTGSPCVNTNEAGTLSLSGSVNPGQTGVLTFQVNLRNAVVGAEHATVAAEFSYGSSPVVYGASNTSSYNVRTTGGVASVDFTDTDSPLDDDQRIATAVQGTTQTFQFKVTNNGTAQDTFDLTVPSSGGTFPAGTRFSWETTAGAAITSSAGSADPDTGTLAAGASTFVVLRVELPPRAISATSVTVTVTATSVNDSTKTDTTKATIGAITARTVDVSPTTTADGPFVATAASTSPTTANPGQTVVLSFTVTNPSSAPNADSFNLEVFNTYTHSTTALDTNTAMPASWIYSIQGAGGSAGCASVGSVVTSTATIAIGAHCDFTVEVRIPAGTLPMTQTLFVRATSAIYGFDGTTEADFDVMKANIVVNSYKAMTLSGLGAQTAASGTSTSYGHRVCNVGNIEDTSVSIASANSLVSSGWTNAMFYDADGDGTPAATDSVFSSQHVGIGSCISLANKVNAPASAPGGAENQTALVMTVTWSDGTTTTVSTTDTTTIVAGNIIATKTQAPIASGAATWPSASTFSSSPLAAQAPGAIIAYEATLSNNGSTPASSVTIRDTAPNYTTFYGTGTCAPKLVVGGVAVAGAATTSGSQINGVVGTLNPGKTAVLSYCVQLNQ